MTLHDYKVPKTKTLTYYTTPSFISLAWVKGKNQETLPTFSSFKSTQKHTFSSQGTNMGLGFQGIYLERWRLRMERVYGG